MRKRAQRRGLRIESINRMFDIISDKHVAGPVKSDAASDTFARQTKQDRARSIRSDFADCLLPRKIYRINISRSIRGRAFNALGKAVDCSERRCDEIRRFGFALYVASAFVVSLFDQLPDRFHDLQLGSPALLLRALHACLSRFITLVIHPTRAIEQFQGH